MYYYRVRHYDPRTGRFLSEDPIDIGGGDTNLYRYVKNMATKYIDPSGKKYEKEMIFLGFAAATAAILYVTKSYLLNQMENILRTIMVDVTVKRAVGCNIYVTEVIKTPKQVEDQDAINRNKQRLDKIKRIDLRLEELNKEIRDILELTDKNKDLA